MTQAEYHKKRRDVIDATSGINMTISLDQAAKLLPENPEWTNGIPRLKRKSSTDKKADKE